MQQIRSPFGNIFNIMNGLPQGHEKPLKHALYNALALFLLIVSLCVCWALYLILEPFIKPLTWALLVGSVLHPIKYNISTIIVDWCMKLERNGTPMFMGVMLFPVEMVNKFSLFIGNNIMQRLTLILTCATGLPCIYILYYYTPEIFVLIIWKFSSLLILFISHFMYLANIYTVFTSLVILLITSTIYCTPEFIYVLRAMSVLFWLIFTCYVAKFFPSYEIHLFICLLVFYLAGFVTEVLDIYEKIQAEAKDCNFIQCIMNILFNNTNSITTPKPELTQATDIPTSTPEAEKTVQITEKIPHVTQVLKIESPKKSNPFELELFKPVSNVSSTNSQAKSVEKSIESSTKVASKTDNFNSEYFKGRSKSISSPPSRKIMLIDSRRPLIKSLVLDRIHKKYTKNEECDRYTSGFYIYIVFWACVVLIIWKNVFLSAFLPIPIGIFLINKGGSYLGVWDLVGAQWNFFKNGLFNWLEARADTLLPLFIRGVWKIICKINAQVEYGLRNSIDSVASVVVILGLILFVTMGSVFMFFQVYSEGIMLVQVGSSIVNNAIVNNPELSQYLPPEWNDTVDCVLDNAYQYGREGISKVLRGAMRDVENEKAIKLEHQVLELWDRIYQNWVYSNSVNEVGPKVTSHAVQHSWDEIVADLPITTEMFNIQGLVEFVKQNIGTFLSLLESVWLILKGNINLILAFFSAFLSMIFGGGTAVLNFLLNVIVFLTTLFYLLAASGRLYKPVEFLSTVSTNGSHFGLALEQAINGVFKATGQMALFYGLWTWFIHNLFNVRIVYLPTVLATILAAVPFLGPYWACLPAVFSLWLAQGQPFTALFFAVCQFAPSYFIDTKIYEEIKGGGHPYLTALAIAGGVFWLGVEGAIIGPLLLCGLFVAVDLSTNFFKESPLEEPQLPRLHRYCSQPDSNSTNNNRTIFA